MYAIIFAAAAIIWPFVVAAVANKYGPDVSARFLERSGTIASNNKTLTRESLEEWLTSPATGKFARPYARLIMILDLAYIFFAGGFMLTGAYWLAEALAWPDPVSVLHYLLYLLPVLYMLADTVEDVLIMIILPRQSVSASSFAALRAATHIKIFAFGLAVLQILVLGACALRWSAI